MPPPCLYYYITACSFLSRKGVIKISENGKKSKYAAQEKYEAENVRRVVIKLNKKTDSDILSAIDDNKPVATQLKQLIRKGLK